MKTEYDFSKAKRGKFYRPDAIFDFPIYLEPDVNDFLTQVAEQKHIEVQELVNEWLRATKKFVQSVHP